MLIRWAENNDLPYWYEIATELSTVMRHPGNMGADPEFISYAQSKTSKHEALTAINCTSGKNMGFIGFSRTFNRITWLGVSEKFRGKGIGERLLKTALHQLDYTKPITVETYPDDYEPGIPAKNLYRKIGFVETESNLLLPHFYGKLTCRMTLDLSSEKNSETFHLSFNT